MNFSLTNFPSHLLYINLCEKVLDFCTKAVIGQTKGKECCAPVSSRSLGRHRKPDTTMAAKETTQQRARNLISPGGLSERLRYILIYKQNENVRDMGLNKKNNTKLVNKSFRKENVCYCYLSCIFY